MYKGMYYTNIEWFCFWIMFPVKRTGWVFCLYVTPWLCVNVFCAGSFAGDVLRLLADGLGTTFVNNRHDNQARRKGTGQCSNCRFFAQENHI